MKDMNHYDTFVSVSEDCPAARAEIPKAKEGSKTVPVLQFEMLADHPYEFTQEDVLFEVHARRQGIPEAEWPSERAKFFSKGQPCLRTSSLCKRYGWGIHHDSQGKVALYGVESEEYRALASDENLTHVKGMRSSRK